VLLLGNTRRAIDFHDGDPVNEPALKALVRAAAPDESRSASTAERPLMCPVVLSLLEIGLVQSSLTDLADAPRQGAEGAPDAWLEVHPRCTQLNGLLRLT
jgi:hypothetical protein